MKRPGVWALLLIGLLTMDAGSSPPQDRITDFKGKVFSSGSNLSTSGHLLPRHFLKEMGIEPENYFSWVDYSGKHDLAAKLQDAFLSLSMADNARPTSWTTWMPALSCRPGSMISTG